MIALPAHDYLSFQLIIPVLLLSATTMYPLLTILDFLPR